MFSQDGKEFDCCYCHHQPDGGCSRGFQIGAPSRSIIAIDGVDFVVDWSAKIEPGDTYVGQRNTGPKLLTCREVSAHFVVPVEMAYCYDTWECAKVIALAETVS